MNIKNIFIAVATVFALVAISKEPNLLIIPVIYLIFKITFYFINKRNKTSTSNNIDERSDTDAINEDNFMTINNKNRNVFFQGNYFNKEDDGQSGTLRKLTIIEPIYLKYDDFQGNISHRKVEVFGIKTYQGGLYLYGFCHQKGEERTFKFTRISLLVDKNKKHYPKGTIADYIKNNLVPHVESDYNKKVVLNCLKTMS